MISTIKIDATKLVIISLFLSMMCFKHEKQIFAQALLPSEFCRTTLSGAIDNNFIVQMSLLRRNEKLEGTYVYASYHLPIKLSGTVDKNGAFVIREYTDQGMLAGAFVGKFISPEQMEGIWTNEDGTRQYPFALKRQRSIEHQIALPLGVPFQIIRDPIEAEKDVLFLIMDNQCVVPFYEESCGTYLDASTINVQVLPGSPRLWQIEWQTEPEGQGAYSAHYYMLLQEGSTQPLIVKGWVSSGRGGWNSWKNGRLSIHYANNQLWIIENYIQLGTNRQNNTLLTLQEVQVERVYEVEQAGIRLLRAERRQRMVHRKEFERSTLETLLQSAMWEIQPLPIEQALSEYPAIRAGYF